MGFSKFIFSILILNILFTIYKVLLPLKRRVMQPTFFKFFLTLGLAMTHLLAAAQVKLIKDDEAKAPNLQVPATRAITRGPGISLQTPLEVNAKSFAFKLTFEPRGGSKIDVSSVKFEYLKQPTVDLTARFTPGLNGNTLELAHASVPVGTHPIRVLVRDSEGREAQTTIQLTAK